MGRTCRCAPHPARITPESDLGAICGIAPELDLGAIFGNAVRVEAPSCQSHLHCLPGDMSAAATTKKREHADTPLDAMGQPAAKKNAPKEGEEGKWHKMTEGDRIWTPTSFPKPASGNLLLTWIYQSTSSIISESFTQFVIPIDAITAERWDLLVTANGLTRVERGDTYDEMVGEKHADKVEWVMDEALPQYIDTLSEYECPSGARPLPGAITAFITCGLIGD